MIQATTLENGIRVITEKTLNSRSLGIGILVDSSPRSESSDKAGLAHLLEHALFHGTTGRDSLEISKLVNTMGGRVAAFTGRDYTCLSALVMDDHRTYVLDLFSDIILNSIFPADKLEQEKQVVLQEQESGADIPFENISQILKENIWKNHALGRPIDGYPGTVAGLTREDVIYYLHNTYLPNRITIALAGNLEHEDIVSQVQDCFWRMIGSVEEKSNARPEFTPCNIVRQTSYHQSYFTIGIPAPEYTSSHRYGVYQLNTILGGGLSSRLFRRLREEKGLVYNIQSEYLPYKDAGLIAVSGSTAPVYQKEVMDIVVEEIDDLFSCKKPVTQEEAWQAEMYSVGQHFIDSEDLYTRMSRLLTQSFYFGDPIPSAEIVRHLRGITPEYLGEISTQVFPNISKNMATVISEGVGE